MASSKWSNKVAGCIKWNRDIANELSDSRFECYKYAPWSSKSHVLLNFEGLITTQDIAIVTRIRLTTGSFSTRLLYGPNVPRRTCNELALVETDLLTETLTWHSFHWSKGGFFVFRGFNDWMRLDRRNSCINAQNIAVIARITCTNSTLSTFLDYWPGVSRWASDKRASVKTNLLTQISTLFARNRTIVRFFAGGWRSLMKQIVMFERRDGVVSWDVIMIRWCRFGIIRNSVVMVVTFNICFGWMGIVMFIILVVSGSWRGRDKQGEQKSRQERFHLDWNSSKFILFIWLIRAPRRGRQIWV